jgi:hypothetical protein
MGEMNDSVRYFVKGLFRGMPETSSIAEQREELEGHINDRIADNMARGLTHDDAFARVVESLGDLDELIETMTGRKKKVYALKAKWHMMAIGFAYGTLYMIAVGVWFAFHDFGWTAVYIAIPGWLGYAVPSFIKYARYRRAPMATALEPIEYGSGVTSSLIGWAAISSACWAVNVLFMGTGFFLNVVWAWMPTVGLFTWPLLEFFYVWLIRRQPPIERDAW